MGVTLYCKYYPNKCNDAEILPFLSKDTDMDWNGKHLPVSFYDNCRELATYNEVPACYIFADVYKLFEFAGRTETPSDMSDYITSNYQEDWIFIIWLR
jgi:hypothetical protein